MMRAIFKYILCCLFMGFGTLVVAQIPDTQYSDGIAYISGGVGEEESTAILAEAKQWSLLLELSQIENGRGVWIFGAQIKVLNSLQKVIFNAQANGPYMLINLAPGNYQIVGTYQGVEQRRALTIKTDSSQKINLFWK